MIEAMASRLTALATFILRDTLKALWAEVVTAGLT
jgi:hypothetical protein